MRHSFGLFMIALALLSSLSCVLLIATAYSELREPKELSCEEVTGNEVKKILCR